MLKVIFRKNLNQNLNQSIEKMRAEAVENGLTDEKLEEILKQIDNERTAELHSWYKYAIECLVNNFGWWRFIGFESF